MDGKTLETLEFDKIREKVRIHAQSELGKEKADLLVPLTDRHVCEQMQEETENAVNLLLSKGNPPLFGIFPVRAQAAKAALGGILSPRDLLRIAESLRVCRAIQDYAQAVEEKMPFLDLLYSLFTQKGLEELIYRAIISEEEISDRASNRLFTIRRTIRTKEEQIKTKLNEILLKAQESGHLQENLITMREGRYVLPVRSESRNRVQGVVHDQSGSGHTLYVEPIAIVNLNNEIRRLEIEEKDEIERILADLSTEVGAFSKEIGQNEEKLVHIDFTFSKAQYALEIGGSRPIFTQDRVLSIKKARHPLLGKNVVPIDFSLGEDFTTLIITGPNTGGKTVTLKTVGLLSAMAQAGLQIPALTGSKLGIFRQIYADIGDKQSIEMSLSTFSASMKNIVMILEKANRDCLLLFDELGSGTDPTEGAALAMAILESLTQKDIRTVATTHYAELKLFAISKPYVQNASVEFDVNTLSPTYRLMIGLPGRSNAFEISRRLGLSEELLKKAGEHLDQENVQFEDVLRDIEENRLRSERERMEMERSRKEYEEKLLAMQKTLAQAESAYENRLVSEKEKIQRYVQEAKNEAREIIRKAKLAADGRREDLDRSLTQINDRSRELLAKFATDEKKSTHRVRSKDEFKQGDRVVIAAMGQEGIIVEGPDKNGDVLIQMGILKVSANTRELVPGSGEEEKPKQGAKLSYRTKTMSLSPELDLRGFRYTEALDVLDRYLDDAILANLSSVRIIHGKGTGALRKGVSDLLKKDSRITDFHLADMKEGGYGVTVVHFE